MLPVPAIGTELTGRDSHRFHQIIQTVVAECGKIQPFADFFDHFRIILAVRVCIAVKDLLRYIVSLTVADDPSGDQIQLRGRTGKVQIRAAKEHGFLLKLHADEIVSLGGAELAAELGALSADHLLHASDAGIRAMADAGVVATLLPLTAFALKEPYARGREMIDVGCAVALATDLNPGSCFSGSIPLTIALACIYMQMSIEETITALTLNGAAALQRADRIGSIEVGKQGDFVILNSDNYHILPYYIGMNCVIMTIKGGILYPVA